MTSLPMQHANCTTTCLFACCSFSEESPVCRRFFTIDTNTSTIRTVGMLDREAIYREEHTDELQCFVQYINTNAGINGNVLITINILDINDEVPHFRDLFQPHVVQVIENVAAPTPLLRLEPIDDDSGVNGTVHFSIINGDTNYFTIMRPEGDTSDTATRLLFLQTQLDFEAHNRRFDLTVRILDMGSPSNNVFDQQIVIVVNNSMDEPPTFPTTRFMFQVLENHPVGISHPFANVTAANSNQVLGSIFYYLCEESGCVSSGPDGVILVNEVTGDLYLNQSLDYGYDDPSAIREYIFYVKASNPSTGASQNAFVQVVIEDVNDHAPYFTCSHESTVLPCPPESPPDSPLFTRMSLSTHENELTDMRRLRLEVWDDDPSDVNSLVEYSYSSEPHIDIAFIKLTRTVVLFGIDQMLDRELTPDITVTITVRNTASPQLNSTATVTVHVEDLNDNAPIFTQSLYNAYISEGSPVGKYVTTVEALDSDAEENGTVSYRITTVDKAAAENWFQIDPTTGVISVAADNIDYHAVQGVVVLNITASDNGVEPLSSTALVQVEIVPAITFSARSYQAFANYNLAAGQDLQATVYLEFQTSSRDGVLLYHQGEDRSGFSLALEEGKVTFRNGKVQPTKNEVPIVDDVWYSVLLEKINTEQVSAMLSPILCYVTIATVTYSVDSMHGHHASHSVVQLQYSMPQREKPLNYIT